MSNLNIKIKEQTEEMLNMFYCKEDKIATERNIVFKAQENKGDDIIAILKETENDDNSALFDVLLKGK